jgi:hypothetical protein
MKLDRILKQSLRRAEGASPYQNKCTINDQRCPRSSYSSIPLPVVLQYANIVRRDRNLKRALQLDGEKDGSLRCEKEKTLILPTIHNMSTKT